jgi:hypothetical protein
MASTEERVINEIARHERSISGIESAYNFAKNPDDISGGMLPCVLHYTPRFTSEPRMHHNVWRNRQTLSSLLFVAPRESRLGKMKYLENAAMPFGDKWRTKFQTESVIKAIFAEVGGVRVFLTNGRYVVGGTPGGAEMMFNNIPFIGWVFQFEFSDA